MPDDQFVPPGRHVRQFEFAPVVRHPIVRMLAHEQVGLGPELPRPAGKLDPARAIERPNPRPIRIGQGERKKCRAATADHLWRCCFRLEPYFTPNRHEADSCAIHRQPIARHLECDGWVRPRPGAIRVHMSKEGNGIGQTVCGRIDPGNEWVRDVVAHRDAADPLGGPVRGNAGDHSGPGDSSRNPTGGSLFRMRPKVGLNGSVMNRGRNVRHRVATGKAAAYGCRAVN